MAFMRSNVACGLLLLNLVSTILIIFFYTQLGKQNYRQSHYYSYNLRGTNQKYLELNHESIPKELRNLSSSDDSIILYLDIIAIFFVILLMTTFCLTTNECCSNDPELNREFAIGSCYGTCICCDDCSHGSNNNCDCKFDNSGGEGALGLLILLLVLIVFVGLFFAFRACGKHIARIFTVVMLFLVDCGMVGISIGSLDDTYSIAIFAISLICAICNFLGIILPMIPACRLLSYGYLQEINENNQNKTLLITDPIKPDVNVQPTSADFPPQNMVEIPYEKPMMPIYNVPNQEYNSNSGNIYGAHPNSIYQQQNNYNQNISPQDLPNPYDAPPPVDYPSPQ